MRGCCGAVDHALRQREEFRAEVERLREVKDGAYAERNQLVALAAFYASSLGRRAFQPVIRTRIEIGKTIGGNVVVIELPTGQATWHIHDSELPLFDFLERGSYVWDGHTTDAKYARVRAMMPKPAET